MNFVVHAEARLELIDARRWYNRESRTAGRRFQESFEEAVDRIRDDPARWPRGLHRTRFLTLDRFPYVVIYRHQGEDILIVAVAHASRRPGYWKKRLNQSP